MAGIKQSGHIFQYRKFNLDIDRLPKEVMAEYASLNIFTNKFLGILVPTITGIPNNIPT